MTSCSEYGYFCLVCKVGEVHDTPGRRKHSCGTKMSQYTKLGLRSTHGEPWAQRIWVQSVLNVPLPERVQERGCPECAGFGQPGWVVVDWERWEKCECYGGSHGKQDG